MIWIKCNVCGRWNNTDTYSLTDDIITTLKEEGIPDNILAELNASDWPVFSRRDAFIRSNPFLDEFPCKPFLPIIAAKAHSRRKKCQWCGSDLSLRNTRWFPSARFQKVTELLQPGKGDLPNGMSQLMPFVHSKYKVKPITKSKLTQLSALDLKTFKEGNQFGDDMITLAEKLPHCVFVLFDENNDVKGFLDVFFFEPNTFCLPEELLAKLREGELPSASDILNNRLC